MAQQACTISHASAVLLVRKELVQSATDTEQEQLLGLVYWDSLLPVEMPYWMFEQSNAEKQAWEKI